jgi:hypothetical protein
VQARERAAWARGSNVAWGGRGSDAARACRPGAAAGPNGGFSLFMATRRVYFLFSFLCAAFFVDEPTHLDLV